MPAWARWQCKSGLSGLILLLRIRPTGKQMHKTCRKEGVLMPVNVNEIEPDEKIVEIEMERLREFRNHPFKVKADGQMLQLIESISKYGVMNSG